MTKELYAVVWTWAGSRMGSLPSTMTNLFARKEDAEDKAMFLEDDPYASNVMVFKRIG